MGAPPRSILAPCRCLRCQLPGGPFHDALAGPRSRIERSGPPRVSSPQKSLTAEKLLSTPRGPPPKKRTQVGPCSPTRATCRCVPIYRSTTRWAPLHHARTDARWQVQGRAGVIRPRLTSHREKPVLKRYLQASIGPVWVRQIHRDAQSLWEHSLPLVSRCIT